MTEYIIEVGKIQFYAFCPYEPEGYIANTIITIDMYDKDGYVTEFMEFEDEVRILEKETRKVIFDSRSEEWESFR